MKCSEKSGLKEFEET